MQAVEKEEEKEGEEMGLVEWGWGGSEEGRKKGGGGGGYKKNQVLPLNLNCPHCDLRLHGQTQRMDGQTLSPCLVLKSQRWFLTQRQKMENLRNAA